jgi:DNA-binding LacI/PurR family transcriptional regulator
MEKNEASLKQIAQELHLSIGAVSRGLRDCSDISEATKEKVRLKAIELGYVPNLAARNLATGRSNTVAVILDSLSSPYFGMVSEWLIKELRKRGYQTLLMPVSELYATKSSIKEALGMGVDAVITFLVPSAEAVEMARLAKKPILLFGRFVERKGLLIFYSDDEEGGKIAADYLIQVKRRKSLAYLGAKQFDFDAVRNKGFSDEANKLGVTRIVRIEDSDLSSLPEKIHDGIDGIFCFDDLLASRALNLLKGEDVSVVGFNGTSHFYDSVFDITSIESDYPLMVKSAVNALSESIRGRNEKPITSKFPVHLYLGQS